MKKATSSAPHICLNVLENTCPMIGNGGRKRSSSTTQETKMEVPPAKGVKLKTDRTAFCVTEELAATDRRNQLTPGRCDHGPVHETTTAINTMYGNQIASASAAEPSSD